MIFKQLFEEKTSTYTYLFGCESTRKAILIDTVACDLDKYITLLLKNWIWN